MNIYTTIDIDTKIDNLLGKSNFPLRLKSDCLYILYHIRTYPFKDRGFEHNSFVPLKMEYLRNLISSDFAKKLLDLLIEGGLIETDNQYIIGKKSKYYRITDKYLKGKFFLKEMENKELALKIKNKLERIYNEVIKRNDAYSYVTKCVENVNIDKEKAELLIQKYPVKQRDKIQLMLDIFENKFASVDKTGNRLHNNITNLATPLRSCLDYNGQVIVQCDVKNSQPLLFRAYLSNYPFIPQEELDKYLDVVCNIGFYEFFAEKLGVKLTEKNRSEFKKKIFGGVLFDRNRKKLSKYEEVFQKEFPIINYCMRDMKKENHADIPINLQKLESKFIFHCIDVLRKKHKGIELLTIHDSICTVEGKENLVYNVMIEEFQKMFNITPKIKVEKFV